MKDFRLIGVFLAVVAVGMVCLVLFNIPPASDDGGDGAVPHADNLSGGNASGQDADDGPVQNQSGEMRLDYAVGGCDSHDEKGSMPSRNPAEGIAITVAGDSINLTHALVYVCCAEITVEMERKEEGGREVIVLTERNTGEMCKCICEYSVNASVGPLAPGSYDVQLWGIAFEDREPELLFEKEVQIG